MKTLECEKFNQGILNKFLSISSIRKTDKVYVYDSPLEKGFEMELLLGFSTSGKSSIATEPDSKKKEIFYIRMWCNNLIPWRYSRSILKV